MGETVAAGFTDLCLVTAVGIEFKITTGLLTAKSFSEEPRMKICRGFFGARRITVLQSEIGAVGFAERLVKHLADNRYDALIIVGLAGGLDPKLRVGDAVLYDLCYDARAIDFSRRERPVHEEISSIAGDEILSAFLFEALTRSGYFSVRALIQAPGITVGRIITEAKEKLALHVNYGAAAVDMETYGAFAVCARLDLPAAALRVISDEARHNIPDFNRAYDADGRTHGWRMFAALTARPFATFRLLLTIRRALRSLKANLRAAMSA